MWGQIISALIGAMGASKQGEAAAAGSKTSMSDKLLGNKRSQQGGAPVNNLLGAGARQQPQAPPAGAGGSIFNLSNNAAPRPTINDQLTAKLKNEQTMQALTKLLGAGRGGI